MTVFIETEQFNKMISYNPYATTNQEKKNVKYSLLDQIKEGMCDKWERLKEGTRQAFDMICFFSAELGFFYASDEYLAKRHNISERTIRYRFKELEELGLAVKVHRRATKCNGKGKPVYLFVNHPYFNYWANLLGLNMADFHTDCHAENAETPSGSKEKQPKKVSTYFLPKKQESNNNISDNIIVDYVVNRVRDSISKGTKIKYLSSYIDRVVSSLEWQSLYAENRRQEALRKQREEELSKIGKSILGTEEQPKVPFYNWLEN
ncbi:hypothetical protein [Priestia megaterium]|uniref:hypothetical protein n=1 Tax=Priestia megaterium TaxID=1404 RepID=UPI0011B3F31E|nr:hypothetical protein [Priestia megaterium]QDZ88737.1 hypothetical protein D0441_31395 [Priestia megaterium]